MDANNDFHITGFNMCSIPVRDSDCDWRNDPAFITLGLYMDKNCIGHFVDWWNISAGALYKVLPSLTQALGYCAWRRHRLSWDLEAPSTWVEPGGLQQMSSCRSGGLFPSRALTTSLLVLPCSLQDRAALEGPSKPQHCHTVRKKPKSHHASQVEDVENPGMASLPGTPFFLSQQSLHRSQWDYPSAE